MGIEYGTMDLTRKGVVKMSETTSICLKALFESKGTYEDTVYLRYGEILKSVDDEDEWFDLYNEKGGLSCMDGETISYAVNEYGDYVCTNEEGEIAQTFKLTAEEFGIAVFKF